MKKIVTLCGVILINAAAFSQTTLTVAVKNIKDSKGTIRIGLYNQEQDFLKKLFVSRVVKALSPEVTVTFENLPPGEYATSIVHDENENEKLDTNTFGIPKEGYCFSNNVFGTFGPPSFTDVKITLGNAPIEQRITMRY